jgi:hypothetical protein
MYIKKFFIASSKIIHAIRIKKLLILLVIVIPISADSFIYNSYNNHGVVGLINMPTARFFDESVHGFTIYDGTPDQKITMTSSPFSWLEASFFYTNIQGMPYPFFEYQDYKDKGFNLKLRLKDEGSLPAIAIGINDIAGTGFYSSEYLVASYGISNIDFHLGLGWGNMNTKEFSVKNPFTYISDSFNSRPNNTRGLGGQFDLDKYFSGKTSSPFFGVNYAFNDKMIFHIERDTTNTNLNKNFVIGLSYERGNFYSLSFSYKNDPNKTVKKYEFKKAESSEQTNKYVKLMNNLEKNGIGVNKITETSRSLGLELTQFLHSDIALIEKIIKQSTIDAGINKNIKKDIKIADLDAIKEIDETFEKNATIIYQKQPSRSFNTDTKIRFRPFLASREEFFKGALLIENDSEFILRDNLFFNVNLKYSLVDNFDDLRFPPVDTFPAQVRSDIKQYLKNIDNGILIGRAQLDYHLTPYKNHYIMATAGILEDMFSGYGMEYLYFKQNTNYAIGFEIFNVRKRDYDWGLGHLDYENLTYNANFYYRNYGLIPFDAKVSIGEYLAGDFGSTFELSRSFENGVKFGVFATFTDVSKEEFGEGSFDKGIFFNIPIYGNLINYTWRPLTKDPGARLTRRNTLYDLLVKFQPIN